MPNSCRLAARRSWVRFPHGALLVLGAGSPQAFGAQVGNLPGLSVQSLHVLPVFTKVSSTKNPNIKYIYMQKNRRTDSSHVRP